VELNILSQGTELTLDPSVTWDSVIIGGGPAGYNAALYLYRKGLRPLLLVGARGGQVALTNEIENYLGFQSIHGGDLTEEFHQHIIGFEIDLLENVMAESIEKSDDLFKVKLSNNEVVDTKTIILATGGDNRKLGVDGEARLEGKGVSYCAICDAPFFKGKDVVIVGGGDSAVEAAVDLSKWASHVHLVHRSVFRADQVLIDRMMEAENVTYELGSVIQTIGGENSVEYVEIYNKEDDTVVKKETDGVFIEIGQEPRVDLVKDLVDLNDQNQVIVDEYRNTSYPGIFAAGDVTSSPYKQVITAASDGAVAALTASNYIMKMEEK